MFRPTKCMPSTLDCPRCNELVLRRVARLRALGQLNPAAILTCLTGHSSMKIGASLSALLFDGFGAGHGHDALRSIRLSWVVLTSRQNTSCILACGPFQVNVLARIVNSTWVYVSRSCQGYMPSCSCQCAARVALSQDKLSVFLNSLGGYTLEHFYAALPRCVEKEPRLR